MKKHENRLAQIKENMSRIYGISGCKVNLNLARLLDTGKITPSEVEKLKTFSTLGTWFYCGNILAGFMFIGIIYLSANFNRISRILFLSPYTSIIFIGLGLSYSRLGYRKSVLLVGLVIVVGLFLVPSLVFKG